MAAATEPGGARPRARNGALALVWTWLPLATLAGFALAIALVALRAERSEPRRIEPASFADLPALEPPLREARVAGRVRDALGAPVADALVHLRARDEPAWTTTDREGRFALEGLEDGPWTVTVLARWYAPRTSTLADDERAEDCELVLGEPLPEPPSLEPLARAPLDGRVSSAAGLALEGCELWLEPDDPLEQLDGALPVRTALAADGSFRVEDLVLGRYRAHVLPAWARGGTWPDLARPLEAPGGTASGAPGGTPGSSGGSPPGSASTASGARFEHVRGDGALALALVEAVLEGRVLAPGGAPLAGALVTLAPAADARRPWPARASDEQGRFRFDDLPAGRYRVRARAGEAAAEQELELAPGESRALELELHAP